jgi:hypothetical protein
MQSTLTPTETDPHDIFVIEPDVVLAARADHTPAAPAVDPVSHPAPPQAEKTPDAAAAVSVPTVDTTFRATAAPAAGEIRAPEIEVPGDIHLLGKRPPRVRMARAILGFVFAIGAAAATAAWNHYGDTAKTMIANWTPFVLAPPSSQAAAKPTIAEQPSPPDTQASAQASATDQAAAPSAPAAQPAQDTAPATAAAPPPSAGPDIAAMSQQIEALKASIEQLKAGQEQLSQQMAQQAAKETAKANAARKLSALGAQPVPPPAHKPRPAFSPAMAAAALASSRPPAPATPPQAAYRPLPQPAAAPPQYQPRAQIVDQPDVDADAVVVRPPMPVR